MTLTRKTRTWVQSVKCQLLRLFVCLQLHFCSRSIAALLNGTVACFFELHGEISKSGFAWWTSSVLTGGADNEDGSTVHSLPIMVSEREAQGKDLRQGKGREDGTIKISKLSDFSPPLPHPDLNSLNYVASSEKSRWECVQLWQRLMTEKCLLKAEEDCRAGKGRQTKSCFCQQFTGVGCWSAAAFGRLREGAMHGWSTFAEVLSARRDISRHRSTTVLSAPRHVQCSAAHATVETPRWLELMQKSGEGAGWMGRRRKRDSENGDL